MIQDLFQDTSTTVTSLSLSDDYSTVLLNDPPFQNPSRQGDAQKELMQKTMHREQSRELGRSPALMTQNFLNFSAGKGGGREQDMMQDAQNKTS